MVPVPCPSLYLFWLTSLLPEIPLSTLLKGTAAIKTEPTTAAGGVVAAAQPSTEDPAPMALLKLHELAVFNKLVER